MNKKDANNQLLAVLAAWYFFGRKKDKRPNNPSKGGCVSTIVYVGVILVCFSQGWAAAGFVLSLPFIIGALIGLIPLIMDSARTNGAAGENPAIEQAGEGIDITDGKQCTKYGKTYDKGLFVCPYCGG
jgi:hypothetical protein